MRTEDYEEAKCKKEKISELRQAMARDIDLRTLFEIAPAFHPKVASTYKEVRLEALHPFAPPAIVSRSARFYRLFLLFDGCPIYIHRQFICGNSRHAGLAGNV